jgi:Icc-related predicted phosphoesterase
MNIAVFADVHGRILLAFKLCARWEQETGEKIDLILQAGDLGAFPDEARLDKATIKHARSDPTELGFLHDFLHTQPEVAAILDRTTCNMLFVRGNHEDHLWLDTLEQRADAPTFPVDAYQRIYCLKTGIPYTFERAAETLTLLGIGRIAPPIGADEHKPKYIQPYELERLSQLEPCAPDILLTHDSARDAIFAGSGMDEIRLILDRCQPRYHFFGHYGGPCRQGIDTNGKTAFCKLADLDWDHAESGKTIEAGAMGLLRWKNRDEHSFEVIDQPWLKEYNAFTWRYI